VACSRFLRADEVRAKQAAEDAEAGQRAEEEGEGTQRKRRKGPPGPRPRIPLNFTLETLSADAYAETTTPLFVGTTDGRMLLLKIVLEKGKPRCTLMHDVSVMQGPDADSAPVAVMAVRDRVVAGVSSKSGTSLNVYNYSTAPHKLPGLIHYVPLDVGGQQQLQVGLKLPTSLLLYHTYLYCRVFFWRRGKSADFWGEIEEFWSHICDGMGLIGS